MSVGARDWRIDLVRGVSILLVLLDHFDIAYGLQDMPLAYAVGWEAVHAVARNGNYGVTMFFVVSGFLITSNAVHCSGNLAHVQVCAFYVQRVARVLPCLLLLLAVANVLALGGMSVFRSHAVAGPPPSLWLADLASLGFWMNVLVVRHGWFN